jgi:hypothetical protein
MGIRTIALCCVVLLAGPLYARESTDVIVMKNGDHLTGEVKGLSAGVLYVSMKYILGTSSVQWSEVSRLESKQLFLVKTENGLVYTGVLKTSNAPGDRPLTIEVAESPGKEVEIESSHIVQMDQTSTKFFQRFNGTMDTGIIYSKGNQSTQYSIGSALSYPRKRWSVGANFSSNLSASTGATASTRNQLGLAAYHLLPWNNWFYGGLGTLLQSSEEGIDRQTTAGGGIGRYFKNTNRARISLLVGLAGQNTAYHSNFGSQNLTGGLITTNIQFFRFNKTNGTVNAVLMPVISQPGRLKLDWNANYYIKITGNLSWNISLYGNWDNKPPNGLSGTDYGSSSGLSWTFGNR